LNRREFVPLRPRTAPGATFQLDNHLGTACVETDGAGLVISYEEYHPYGTSSYRAFQSSEVSDKRYRYTGKERDEETGLYYHGARYYAAWLGRWTAADPMGTVDGTNLYAYVRGSPIGLSDPSGSEGCNPEVPERATPHGPEFYRRIEAGLRRQLAHQKPEPKKPKPPVRKPVSELKPSEELKHFVAEREVAPGAPMELKIELGASVGYGHDIKNKDELDRLLKRYGPSLTRETAWALLGKDLEGQAKAIRGRLQQGKVELTQGEFDALVSQGFNSALYNKRGQSQTLAALNRGASREEVGALMLDAVTSKEPKYKGGAVQGLAERRFEELKMFFGGGYAERNTEPIRVIAQEFVDEFNAAREQENMARAALPKPLPPLRKPSNMPELQTRFVQRFLQRGLGR
jgi:RHS repeat-associated protein